MNSHMNIFTPFADGRPIEDNISRGLAIVLKENLLARDRFINAINTRLTEQIAKPDTPENFSVDIQQSATDIAGSFDGVSRVIPVTLTPEEAVNQDDTGGAENPEVDIAVKCGNEEASDLVIIEVKLYGNSAHAQVKHQAESIIEKGLDAEAEAVIHLEWSEVIRILQNVQAMSKDRKDSILDDYLEYVQGNRPELFPVQPFGDKMNSTAVWKRIYTLAQNCAEIVQRASVGETNFSYRVLKPSWGYMGEFHLTPTSLDGTRTAEEFGQLSLEFWPGNTRAQSRFLFGDASIDDDMSWIHDTSIQAGGKTFAMSVNPYLKFGHIQGRFAGEAWASSGAFGTDRKEIAAKMSAVSGRWQRDSWPELKARLSSEDWDYDITDIENSGKNFIDVSAGYYIRIDIPLGQLIELDGHKNIFMKPAYDKAADLVVKIVDSLRKKIEKQ